MRRLVAVLLGCVLCGSVHATSIEARLIRASNEDGKSDAQLAKLVPKLKKVFGYQLYKQLGIQKADFKDKRTLRLDLGEGIVVFVTHSEVEDKVHTLDFEMFSGRAALVKSTVHVHPGRTMLIKGPDVGDTLLVISLVVVE